MLRSGSNRVALVASIDTGASFCLFAAEVAARLGIDLTDGHSLRFRTATGVFQAYGHEVEITAPGVATYSTVYLFADLMISKNVLGRVGWLDRVRLAIVDHDSRLYFSPYDSAV